MKQTRQVWIFHHYATLPNLNGHIRPYRFAQYLKETKTTIFASSYQHFSDINLIDGDRKYIINTDFDTPFVFVRTPPSSAGKASRIKNMLAFYQGLFSCSRDYADKYGRPNIIIASSPHPLALIAGIKVAKAFDIPCICEVRDLWPEAIFTASSIGKNSITGKLLSAGERWIYRHADALIFTKEGDTDYLKERGWDIAHGGDISLKKCYYINNGVDLSEYQQQISANRFADSDLDAESFKVVYTGAIRPVNNVGNILDAAKLLLADGSIRFLIYGDGNQREELQRRAVNEGLTNVTFKGFVDRKYIPYILSRSSVNLLNYSGTKYNWSRGNSSNKLFEYMASGKPVISTVKMGYSIIEKYGCGIELVDLKSEALADAILILKDMPQEEYSNFCLAAANGAKDFDYVRLTEKLEEVMTQFCK